MGKSFRFYFLLLGSQTALTFVAVSVSLRPSRSIVDGEVVFVHEPGCLDGNSASLDPSLIGGGGTGRNRILSERAGQNRQKSGGGEERFAEGEHGVRREYSDCKVSEGEGSVWLMMIE